MRQVAYPWIIAGALLVALPISAAQEIQPRMKFKAHSGSTRTALTTADDKFLITRGEAYLGNDGNLVGDNDVKVWDLATGKQRDFPKLAGQSIALSPDNKSLAVADDRLVRLVDLLTGNEVAVVLFKECNLHQNGKGRGNFTVFNSHFHTETVE